MRRILASFLIIFSASIGVVGAMQAAGPIASFVSVRDIVVPAHSVPRVVDVAYTAHMRVPVVYDVSADRFVPSRITSSSNVQMHASPSVAADDNYATYASFKSDGYSLQHSIITVNFGSKYTVDGVRIVLPANVAMPLEVAIKSAEGSVLVARRKMHDTYVKFPQVRTSGLLIELSHIQPLRVSEVVPSFVGLPVKERHMRFLAQAGHQYRVYYNPDRYEHIALGESPNLSDNKDIIHATLGTEMHNSAYKEADADNDGVPDKSDNCVSVSNQGQQDEDGNGVGDVCDDYDKDGIINSKDNCPNEPNRYQRDEDGDGIGDACDGDESRITEKYPWIQWVAMALVLGVIVVLGTIVMRDMRNGNAR